MYRSIKRRLENFSSFKKLYSDFSKIYLRKLGAIEDPFILNLKKRDFKFLINYNRLDHIVLEEFYLREDYKEVSFDKFDILVDIGAHIGAVSLGVSNSCSKIYSVEANPRTFRLLKMNVLLNQQREKIKCINKAVTGKDKDEIHFSLNSSSLRSSVCIEENEGYIKVDTISLKEIISSVYKKSSEKALLKLDCEGSEFSIIQSANERTLQFFDVIFLEWHQTVENFQLLKNELENKGFKTKKIKDKRNMKKGVGFLKATKE